MNCEHCKERGHTKIRCAKLPCTFCRSPKHSVLSCPKRPRSPYCRNCRRKGHEWRQCPRPRRPGFNPLPLGPPPSQAEKPQIQAEEPQAQAVQSHIASGPAICASIREETTRLIRHLEDHDNSTLARIPYKDVIQKCGGRETLADAIVQCIDPTILALQGQELTQASLGGVYQSQTRGWPQHSGYLAVVSDKRDRGYLKCYVGQSIAPERRIGEHTRSIVSGSSRSLFYYIVAKGNGNRMVRFLRLWTSVLPSGTNEVVHVVFNNTLEMLMCRVFMTLPRSILQKWFGPSMESTSWELGLNVTPPLYQGIIFQRDDRDNFSKQCESSSDPEVREWPAIRLEKLRDSGRSRMQCSRKLVLTEADYRYITQQILGEGPDLPGLDWERSPAISSDDMRSLFSNARSSLEEVGGVPDLLVNVFGTPSASIGIVLGDCFFMADADQTSSDESTFKLPWGMLQSGFTDQNVYVAPYNFQQSSADLLENQVTRTSEAELMALRRLHQDIIEKSNLKVILLCGRNAEFVAKPRRPQAIEFEMGGYSVHGFLDRDETQHKRLYLRSPSPIPYLMPQSWYKASLLGDIFKLAATVTRTPGISSWFYSATLSQVTILRRYTKELNGLCGQMTWETIDTDIKTWLGRKGFETEEHVKKLADIAGSLMQGIMVLLHVLPRRQRQEGIKALPPIANPRRNASSWKPEVTDEVRRLFESLPKRQSEPVNSESQARDNMEAEATDAIEDIPDAVEEEMNAGFQVADLEAFISDSRDSDSGSQIAISSTRERRALSSHLPANEPATQMGVLSGREMSTQMTLLSGREYEGQWTEKEGKWSVQLYTNHIKLKLPGEAFPKVIDQSAKLILRVEIKPRGEAHPNKFAIDATNDQSAACIAFRVQFKFVDGEEGVYYPISDSPYAMMWADTYIDWMEGTPMEIIATRPLRFVYISRQLQGVPDHLKHFVSGGYTDEMGNPIPKEKIRDWIKGKTWEL